MDNRSTNSGLTWDIRSLGLRPAVSSAWGIRPLLVPAAKSLLGQKTNDAELTLTFQELLSLVELLVVLGLDVSDLNKAIERGEAITADRRNQADIVRSLQTVLQTFFQNYDPGNSGLLAADGIWGQASKQKWNKVREVFGLPEFPPNADLVELLNNLSSRVLRIRCREASLLSAIRETPLFVIDNKNPVTLELALAEPGVWLLDEASRRQLVLFSQYPSGPGGQQEFLNFIRWYAIVKMPAKNRYSSSLISIRNGKTKHSALDLLPTESKKNFISGYERYLELSSEVTQIQVRYDDEEEQPVDLLAMHLTNDFIIPIPVISGNQAKNYELQVPIKKLPANAAYTNNPLNIIRPQANAEFLKILVLKKGVLVPDADPFNQIFTLREQDIYECHTIALGLDKESSGRKEFNNRWILVAGTGNRELSREEAFMAEAIGRALAVKGYGMVCGGWPGVDEVSARSFKNALAENMISDKERLIQLIQTNQQPIYDYGKIERIAGDWYEEASQKVSALIMIGGKGGTINTYRSALKRGLTVIPIASTGGDSQSAYDQMVNTTAAIGWEDIRKDLEVNLFSQEAADSLAGKIIAVLDGAPRLEPGLSKRDFTIKVAKLYEERPVVFSDDLQKGRWGGRSESADAALEAEVSATGQPRHYRVWLTVLNIKHERALSGRIAFFLHDTFEEVVRYTEFKNGKAVLELYAYEAFTAAAYLEDGTELELDLNKVPGFPQDFYYEDVSDDFKLQAEKIYRATPQVVKDDIQKNRWGRQSTANNKELSATVRESEKGGPFIVTAEVSGRSLPPFTGEVAFFVHDSFKHQIIYKKAENGRAVMQIEASESFTLGAYTSDGDRLELDLQAQKGYPKKFYYRNKGIGQNGFYTREGIIELVDNVSTVKNAGNSAKNCLLIFSTKTQHTWLVATRDEVYIVLDDDKTRQRNNLIMTGFAKNLTLPVDTAVKGKSSTVKFPGNKNRWYYSHSLFPSETDLNLALSKLIGTTGSGSLK